MINIRDKGAHVWESWNRPKRSTFVVFIIGAVALLPYAGDFSFTSILDTPISSYQAVLVYPVGMYILMALGLNIVVGKFNLKYMYPPSDSNLRHGCGFFLAKIYLF